ncbi:MAG: FAD-dependent oxidoreductase [Bacteroidota bacterium]
MNLRAGYPFWLIKHGLPFAYPQLIANEKTTVVVMGGGISGALTAWQLINNGIDCIVVDARTIGLGSTCASTSLLQYEIDEPLSKLQHKVGLQHAARSYHLCRQSIDELSDIAGKIGFTDFEMKQSLYYAAFKKDISFIEKEFTIRKQHGFKVSLLNANDIKKQFGFDAPAAILSKHGAQTNAYMFTHHLLQSGIKKGLQVFDRTNIAHIQHNKNNVVLTTETGYTITAKKIVYATGYEVINYINKPIVKLLSTYATVSEQTETQRPFWNKDVLIWNTADPYLYMRTTKDGRILVGGRDEEFYSPAKRDKLIESKAKQLSGDFKKLFPQLPFKSEFNWTGTFGATKDGLPFIGAYKPLPNSYFALGFGGNGITFSQVAATIICNQVLGKKDKDAEIFSFDRI